MSAPHSEDYVYDMQSIMPKAVGKAFSRGKREIVSRHRGIM